MISREMISRGLGCAFAVVAASFCLGSQAQAQSVPYWTSTTGFGSALTSDPNASNLFGNFSSRYNFENGWFVGSERGNLGWGLSNFASPVAFGNGAAFTYEGTQAGYNFKSAPVSVYAGFDTIKYNGPGIGNPFTALELDVLQQHVRLSRECRRRVPSHLESQPLRRCQLLAAA